jgi:ribosomal protein S18 acetylase RimI-like enzyme
LVLGFYTLATSQVERSTLPSPITKRLPDYPVRVILIGRLARDERCKGMGVGEHLLDDAHRRALRINADIGNLLVIVDAKNERSAAFYEAHDYAPLIHSEAAANRWPQRFYVKMATLRASYEGTSP